VSTLVQRVCDVGDFIRRLRVHARFGRLSRAPLRLLRLELRGNAVECDLIARAADRWDAGLPRHVSDCNVSRQALEDAIGVRKLLWRALPNARDVVIRVYRQSNGELLELIIAGKVTREQNAARRIPSLAMRAKLCGLQFCLEDGVLEPLERQDAVQEHEVSARKVFSRLC
jgi:hypothetical protein